MRTTLACLGSSLVLVVSGCGGGDDNSPPKLDPIPDQVAAVGTELSVALRATDPDGDPITFSYKADLGDIKNRAQLTSGAGGTAVFKWVPIGSDVGIHSFDFIASDGKDDARRTVAIDVKSAAGGAGSPVFIKPLGTGTTLDLGSKKCVELPIVIQDADSTQVEIAQEPPLIDGATLEQTDGLEATWSWCPTPEQISGGELFSLLLSAYDSENAKVLKDFLIVLQKGVKPDCPGDGPVITHSPGDQSTNLDIAIDADVSDDKGLKYPPLLMYSTTDPGQTPDLSAMTQVTMTQVSGDMVNGKWTAAIPNPVADKPTGTTGKLFYLIVANDNDDAEGDCDHQTRSPDPGSHSMTVTNATSSGQKECSSCSSDVQCGGPEDNCIFVAGAKVCGLACIDDFDCPLSHECSTAPVLSVSGKSAKQCIPSSGKCGGSTTQCTDDSHEDNDTLTQVKTKPGLPAGTYQLKSCPGAPFDDEDWYPIDIASESTVTATLSGGASSNLDLMLKDSTGKVVVSSAKPGSQESVTSCLTPGRYYFHVWAWSKAENSYSLTWSKQNGCTAQCVDDSSDTGGKNDDNKSQARDADITSGPYKSAAQQICAWDDDWFKVFMVKDETIKATLKFTQTKASEDLDLYLYDPAGVQLTKCTEADPWECDSSNGQSSTSNENLSYKIPATGDYFVVVHGWEGAQNKYDICIDYTSTSKTTSGCPAL
ncbi:MAG: pre-peptidase C-terminal domain-containing protein [Polyangiaceae bacterium]|nr:pre-peptidase C-terminal domain-containing protein [Polyangiaceae bacterium]